MTIQGVFVDRDGTINVDKGYVYKQEEFEYIPGAVDALRLLTEKRVKIYIVTNQAGIARGIYTESDFKALTRHMLDDLARRGVEVADVLYCPHHPEGSVAAYSVACRCRKPSPGMLESVMDKEGLDSSCLALIGDKNSDIDAGRSLGIRTYLVNTGYGSQHKNATHADHVVQDLGEAVRHLLCSVGQGPKVNRAVN